MRSVIRLFVLFSIITGFALKADSQTRKRLINGTPVPSGSYKEVVRITSSQGACTATLVGPRVLMTAGHCGANGGDVNFKYNGSSYKAQLTHSPIYPAQDHDIALGYIDQPINNATYASIGGNPTEGLEINLLGFGCTQVGGGGGNDGILREGKTLIKGFNQFDFLSGKANGTILCFGDSGGPAFIKHSDGKHNLLIGINSKVEQTWDSNYNASTFHAQSQSFLKDFANQKGVKICGINQDCAETVTPDKPTCVLSGNKSQINLGESITFTLNSKGDVKNAWIENVAVGFPLGTRTITPQNTGAQTAWGQVTGPGGTNTCSASYNVLGGPDPTKPDCTLIASPEKIELGQTVKLTLTSKGKVDEALINGSPVGIPLGEKTITPVAKGVFAAWGSVKGPDGSNLCRASYTVGDENPTPSEEPLLTVVPTHCGYNTTGETNVWRVCTAVLKKNASNRNAKFNQVIQVIYRDTTTDVMPIIHVKSDKKLYPIAGAGEDSGSETLTLYANKTMNDGKYLKLFTQEARMTYKMDTLKGKVPLTLQGRSAQGAYFFVEQFGAQ